MEDFLDLINGTLLGDACIIIDRSKYYRYKLTAKDRNFIVCFGKKLSENSINFCITHDKRNSTNILYSSTNIIYKKMRSKWYIEREGMGAKKIIPKDIQLTPTVLLHWYLGDGSLPKRANDKNRVPTIVLATNCFLEEDIDFLILKLKELNLNFYKVRYKSGFTGKDCGYCLYSRTQDGTPFRFFRLIGLECPKEICNYTTSNKGRGSKIHYFKDKWPTEDDWIKILSNVDGIGKIIKERRLELNATRDEINKKLGANKDYMRKIEYGVRFPSILRFRKILAHLNVGVTDMPDTL